MKTKGSKNKVFNSYNVFFDHLRKGILKGFDFRSDLEDKLLAKNNEYNYKCRKKGITKHSTPVKMGVAVPTH